MAQQLNELDWLAYCFVTEELSADEAARFELRLAGDPAACEAVARAVQLREAVAALPAAAWQRDEKVEPLKTVPLKTAILWQPARWAALFAAACVAGIFAVAVVNRNDDRANEKVGTGLAEAWTNYRAADKENMGGSPSPSEEPLSSEGEILGEEELAADLQSPDWLLAAVTVPTTMPTDDGEPSPVIHE